jgi:uncharacterized protein
MINLYLKLNVVVLVKKEYVCPPGKNSKVVIVNASTEINTDSTVIMGFVGKGLLGPIITSSFIEQLPDIKEIGFITSEFLPPISVFYEGKLKHPFRLYHSQKCNLIIGTCETSFRNSSDYNDLAKTICNWLLSEDVNAKEIVMFQGIPKKELNYEYPVYYAAEECMVEFLENYNLQSVKKGIILGPEATLINEILTNKLKTYTLFTPIYKNPSFKGATSIIRVLNEIYNLNLDTEILIEKEKKNDPLMLEIAKIIKQKKKKKKPKELSEEAYSIYR